VTGFNASDGRVLWQYRPEAPLWNFHASFAGDGTFMFQDYEGRAYRCHVSNGTEVWKKGGAVGSWTDGSAILGPNRVVYSVQNGGNDPGHAFYSMGYSGPGEVVARSLDDGELLWKASVPHPPNNSPAIGRLYGHEGLSLVQPIGDPVQGAFGAAGVHSVYAFDAETGKLQWKFEGPRQTIPGITTGDLNPIAAVERALNGERAVVLPNPWSAPTIDGNGTVFVGSSLGPLYALRDANGDGIVEGDAEVSKLETDTTFSGSMSPAFAPGMLVAASSDQLYVFKERRHSMTPEKIEGDLSASTV
jgi:outer membrane protein assembly factor BamB